MIYLILPAALAPILPWLSSPRTLWAYSISFASLISFTSLNLLQPNISSTWHNLSSWSATDPLSTPLLILSCWLIPISLLASINSIKNQSHQNQQTFISLLFIILLALLITFSSLEFSLFYIAFETTLLPTLTLIARWGAQKERLQASIYFLFYTLTGSLPLLITLLALYSSSSSLSIPTINLNDNLPLLSLPLTSIWWVLCLIAFTIKMPIYGFHLWLPKAHVEAPIAGSMILAAILLKLGGYGLARTIPIFFIPSANLISLPLTTFCIWGALVTSIICLRQTDLKALIAYSSVGHMSIVASGIFSLTPWGLSGALTLMIAHGLISSAMFCLANLLYERNNTRTLSISRGFKLITPLLTLWWIITCVSNLGLPPTPNLLGELFIISAIIDWNTLSLPIITLATVFGAVYSLLILSNTNNSSFPPFLSNISPVSSCEHLLISLHLLPLIPLIINPNPITA
uniref:NADH dehydrogenase subunit 4 n=1 Tax=Leptychaster arcticus TaxID=3048001 RepID=UPI00286A2FA5|nr:NADH dehydrogenase subunit 4 [Leptychaster arcticus]WKD83331.1 NADH dehydrogenase subunit 4 [Leptychaster arcticus]